MPFCAENFVFKNFYANFAHPKHHSLFWKYMNGRFHSIRFNHDLLNNI